jgi:hypothetical protein
MSEKFRNGVWHLFHIVEEDERYSICNRCYDPKSMKSFRQFEHGSTNLYHMKKHAQQHPGYVEANAGRAVEVQTIKAEGIVMLRAAYEKARSLNKNISDVKPQNAEEAVNLHNCYRALLMPFAAVAKSEKLKRAFQQLIERDGAQEVTRVADYIEQAGGGAGFAAEQEAEAQNLEQAGGGAEFVAEQEAEAQNLEQAGGGAEFVAEQEAEAQNLEQSAGRAEFADLDAFLKTYGDLIKSYGELLSRRMNMN